MTRRERGQMTPMLIGFVAIVLLAVVVVANASKAYLYRRSLASWADGAAVAAAQGLAESAIYTGEFGEILPVAEDDARDEVEGYVARHDLAGRFGDFAIADVVVDADGSVTVELHSAMEFVWAIGPDGGVAMTASATAIAPISP